MALEFDESTFDVVICSQVYEHVPDAEKMIKEIYRVLKPAGICYFAATNRLSIEEYHYGLPFLSVIPRPLGHFYMRLAGKGRYYYEKHFSYWGLKKITRAFRVIDYTRQSIHDPEKYGVAYMLPVNSRKQRLARIIVDRFYWLCPGYIWLLVKPEGRDVSS
jgi:ubiquinone/menaquinone biosynthesis C-methylase UbiE